MKDLLIAAWVAAGIAAAHGASGAEIAASVKDDRGSALADAVVIAVPADGEAKPPLRQLADMVEQIDLEFVPRVKPVLVGTAVSFPNKDNVLHHVYSFSAAKRFELPLYAGSSAQPVVFDKPGVVVLGCNIHDWMVAYLYVSESPYYAKTGTDGRALLVNLPPRRYTVRVWHPRMEVAEETTRNSADTTDGRSVALAWELRVKPEARVRRAPAGGRGGRY